MMTNLFSIFDQTFFNLNWMSTLLGLLFIPMPFWFIPSRYAFFWNKMNMLLFKELKTLSINKSILLFISLFLFILMNNFIGLFPYIFTSTSHLTLTLTLALPLWLSFMLYGWINNTIHMFTHLIPKSTPTLLLSFMVLIETTSNMIRPGTLAIRLTANMITGHLLLTLLGNITQALPILPVNLLLIIQILLLILEMSIAIIQSYVFTILCIMYSKETH